MSYDRIKTIFENSHFSFTFLYRQEWKKIKHDLRLLNLIIVKKINVGMLFKIIYSNINAKNKTLLNIYNTLNFEKITIEELKIIKNYIIKN